jgi:predicted RNase H-like HicB family nuclease
MQFAVLIREHVGGFELTVPDLPEFSATGVSLKDVRSVSSVALREHYARLAEDGAALRRPRSFDSLWPFIKAEGALFTTLDVGVDAYFNERRNQSESVTDTGMRTRRSDRPVSRGWFSALARRN